MFCYNCGARIDDRTVICPHCGTQVQTIADVQKKDAESIQQPSPFAATPVSNPAPVVAPNHAPRANDDNSLAIVGFVLSFFIPLAGLICSIIGLKRANQGAPYKGLAIAGVVISAVFVGLALLFVMSYGCTACYICSVAGIYY